MTEQLHPLVESYIETVRVNGTGRAVLAAIRGGEASEIVQELVETAHNDGYFFAECQALIPQVEATLADDARKAAMNDWGDDTVDDGRYHHCMVTVTNASPESVGIVLSARVNVDDDYDSFDGRSEWKWFRFPDGTLVLGVFPQGDIYCATEGDHSA